MSELPAFPVSRAAGDPALVSGAGSAPPAVAAALGRPATSSSMTPP